jgi:hypothetical protein
LLAILEATNNLNQWIDAREESICNSPIPDKTTCYLTFDDLGHSLDEACYESGAIYVTTTYTYKCTNDGGISDLFYTQKYFPACLALSCGVEGSKAMQEEVVNGAGVSLEEAGYTCQIMRLSIDDPILPPKNCAEGTTVVMTSVANETEALNAQFNATSFETFCVIDGTSWNCEVDFWNTNHTMNSTCVGVNGTYLETDYELSCNRTDLLDDEMILSVTHDPLCVSRTFCTTEDFSEIASTHAQAMIDRVQQEQAGWTCQITHTYVEDFSPSSMPSVSAIPSVSMAPSMAPTISLVPTVSAAPSSAPTEMSCLQGTIFLNNEIEAVMNETLAIQAKIDEISFRNYCRYSANGLAVTCRIDYSEMEQNMTEACEAQGGMYMESTATILCVGAGTETHMVFENRPGCRYSKCNGTDVTEVVAYELEEWLRYGLEFYKELDDAEHVCTVVDVSVAIGGSEEEDVEISEECIAQSNTLNFIIPVYNQKQISRNGMYDYLAIDPDLREICSSPVPEMRECYVDFYPFGNGLEEVCASNGGQYVESAFMLNCLKDGVNMYMTSGNVPGCVGTICSPGQTELYLPLDHTWLADSFAQEGWTNCQVSVLDVHAPNYVPPSETEAIDDPESESLDGNGDRVGDLTGAGPQFGKLWETQQTQQPTPAPSQPEEEILIIIDEQQIDEQQSEDDEASSSVPLSRKLILTGAAIASGLAAFLC